jgi:hypothetical protein
MKLTVGPLPPAVYWRRRVVVAAGLLIVVLTFTSFCAGTGSSAPGQRTAGARTSSSPTPAASTSVLTPTVDDVTATPSGTPVLGPTAPPVATTGPTGPAPAPTGLCTDAEISVAAAPASTSVRQGVPLKITLKIKNVSGRTCSRDLGADAQELFIQQGTTKTWSSDSCNPPRGTDVRQLTPGIENAFFAVWDGKATTAGCDKRPWAPVGSYRVVGRLAGKLSDPVALQIQP